MPVAPAIPAEVVARQAKSNLAFALACLPADRRRDMTTFYAFCRLVDDIADEGTLSVKDRRIQLGAWRRIVSGEQAPADPIARDLVTLPGHYGFDPAWLAEIIDGCAMDLEIRRYDTFSDLQVYCHKVAGVVGLVSLRLFGLPAGVGEAYAENLGLALQLTNILRDVRTDWENDQRLYLPLEDMAAHGVSETDIDTRQPTAAFYSLMQFESDRALGYFQRAVEARPSAWIGRLQAAEAMRRIYLGILQNMRADGHRVLDRRYRMSTPGKLAILAGAWIRSRRG
ncbi:MAG: phytoene/squalene synthase family protein [Verrucomicrobiales bacterium]